MDPMRGLRACLKWWILLPIAAITFFGLCGVIRAVHRGYGQRQYAPAQLPLPDIDQIESIELRPFEGDTRTIRLTPAEMRQVCIILSKSSLHEDNSTVRPNPIMLSRLIIHVSDGDVIQIDVSRAPGFVGFRGSSHSQLSGIWYEINQQDWEYIQKLSK